ncbi:N-acetyltransferase [Streptomyces sp. RFCAC02]|uniref:N-acetyltransferase n=1 Tax=Streptomyces sp. RFCAC02 TaxID=2499143 RepID=UPI001021C4D3|nr:N-acetyltransferase [Streptomyces sp. RFCAC02]
MDEGAAVVRTLDGPGPVLDRLDAEVLRPSFSDDELSPPDELREGVASGALSVLWTDGGARGPLAAAVGDFDRRHRIVLLTWLAVRPGLRGGGIGGPLLDAAVATWRTAHAPCLVLAEVADPAHHTSEAAHGDPAARLRFYRRHGGRVLDLPYFQPALGPGRRRVPHLLLVVLHADPGFAGSAPDTVDGGVLRTCLEERQAASEGAVGTDPESAALWQAVERPGGVPYRPDGPQGLSPDRP